MRNNEFFVTPNRVHKVPLDLLAIPVLQDKREHLALLGHLA